MKIYYKNEEVNLRRILFHELMHIYCIKTEGAEQFIDSYGSGHTPDPNPEDKVYDGHVNAGYFVWSEFIAEYFAVIKTQPCMHTYADVEYYTSVLLSEVVMENEGAKGSLSMAAAYILSCADVDDVLDDNDYDMTEGMTGKKNVEKFLLNCLRYLYEHIQTESPCKITEEFISELGQKYISFVVANSLIRR